ncbi:hypothetical protein KHP60_24240 [Microvirga sp. 3-52]|uniref:hypothetical protein n=1 Tax=Microvirga sp. 3-52 TaxID=2792425 RepID=UPI001AC83313|nr:hypothetical protein [Microvirga sp. 3-52]MBO1909338.1 hypothetical protein [Microvirga sp. 3-52]MBS7455401.1 hypothetical protein [Microvirga sp. 3-52]
MRVSRRTLLFSAAAAAFCTGGVVTLASSSENNFVRETLARMLGQIRISDAELGTFIKAFKAVETDLDGYKKQVIQLLESSGLVSVIDYGPAAIRDRHERYERNLLTSFLLWTDYLDAQERGRDIVFVGSAGCMNPFANFSGD